MDTPVATFIKIEDIHIDDDFNCRGRMAPIDVEELAEDIRDNGLHQPVVVMPYDDAEQAKYQKKYKLLAGFRRTYAHKILKKDEILAIVKSHLSDTEARLLNLSENLKRRDLNILQEAKALEKLYYSGVPYDEMAKRVGMSFGWVQARIALLKLPDDIQKEAAAGLLNQYQIKTISTIKNKDEQYAAVRDIKVKKAKGESAAGLHTKKKTTINTKRQRNKAEIKKMIDNILETCGPNAASRALAWACGNITDAQFVTAMHDEGFKDFKVLEHVEAT